MRAHKKKPVQRRRKSGSKKRRSPTGPPGLRSNFLKKKKSPSKKTDSMRNTLKYQYLDASINLKETFQHFNTLNRPAPPFFKNKTSLTKVQDKPKEHRDVDTQYSRHESYLDKNLSVDNSPTLVNNHASGETSKFDSTLQKPSNKMEDTVSKFNQLN